MTPTKPWTTDRIVDALRDGPRRITEATRSATAEQLHAAPGPGEWSPNEVLAHLRSCADVWGRCIETILAEDNTTIRAVNPRRWIDSTDYLEQDFRTSMRAFTRQRDALVDVLSGLTPARWSRTATITGAGKQLTRSVLDYAGWLARHEQPHIRQIARATAAL